MRCWISLVFLNEREIYEKYQWRIRIYFLLLTKEQKGRRGAFNLYRNDNGIPKWASMRARHLDIWCKHGISERDTPRPRRGPRIPRTKPYMKDILVRYSAGAWSYIIPTKMESSDDTSPEARLRKVRQWMAFKYLYIASKGSHVSNGRSTRVSPLSYHLHINRNLQLDENHKAMAVFLTIFCHEGFAGRGIPSEWTILICIGPSSEAPSTLPAVTLLPYQQAMNIHRRTLLRDQGM